MQKVTILGAGNFGFALAVHLDRKNDDTLDLWLYARNQELIDHIQTQHTHPQFYPTVELTRTQATNDLAAGVKDSDVIVLAVSSTGLRPILQQLRPLIDHPLCLVSIIKALDHDSGGIVSDVIAQELHGLPVTINALAGGTTGTALTQEQYLGATLAGHDPAVLALLQKIFASPHLRLQLSHDLVGVEYAGALKNLVSLAVGVVAGLGFSYGTQTYCLSLLASECEQFAISRGAERETFDFVSQCWGNDMVMSATDPATRNHQLGVLLGEGHRFSQALEQLQAQGKTAESANTLRVLSDHRVDLQSYPLLQFLVALGNERLGAHEIVKLIETHS